MPDEPLKYFTPPEAAEYLRTSVSTLAKLRVYGGGPAFTRIGRAIRYPRTSLDTYMTDQLVRSTSEKRVVTGSANTAHVSGRRPTTKAFNPGKNHETF